MNIETLYVPGPLHPDFFDGETPIMKPAEGQVFDVKVRVTECTHYIKKYRILARNEGEAEHIAERIVEDTIISCDDEIEVEEVKLSNDDHVTPEMVEEFNQYRSTAK